MHYVITARLRPETAADFHRRLTDGSILGQKPDGKEIVASMGRARLDEQGIARWSAKCFCQPPLKHERETVYDHFFTDIETKEVDDYVEIEGQPLMEHLEGLGG